LVISRSSKRNDNVVSNLLPVSARVRCRPVCPTFDPLVLGPGGLPPGPIPDQLRPL